MLGKLEIVICFQLIDNLIIQANYGGNEAFLIPDSNEKTGWDAFSQGILLNWNHSVFNLQPISVIIWSSTLITDGRPTQLRDLSMLKPPLCVQPSDIKDLPSSTGR